MTKNLANSIYCTYTVPVARMDCGRAAADDVVVLAVRVKPGVLDTGAVTTVVVFCCSPNPASKCINVAPDASRLYICR
jgi:hypothetical protein